jgi:arabinofuranosyltransferase
MNDARVRRLVCGVALLALFAIALRLGWLGDDAYITLRTVENEARGNGLRWNAGDRVQTYTHPLWMLVLAVGRWLSGEVYFTTIAISLALSMVAIALLLRRATTTRALAATAAVLACTRAFVDYATSGLETPLTYVLLVLFVGAVANGAVANGPVANSSVTNGSDANGTAANGSATNGDAAARWFRIVMLAALLTTNRMDLGLVCAPAVLAALRGVPFVRLASLGALAALPFLVWIAFAAFYYGSPFPVTAHAKLFGTGIPARELFVQGLQYARFAITDDPVLLPATVAGLAVGFAQRGTRALAAGALLYVLYVVKVGGDFMAGRFFLPPFVVATALLAAWLSARPRAAIAAGAAALVLFALRGVPAWLRSPASDQVPSDAQIEAQQGIVDERTVYYAHLGLLAPTRAIPVFGALDALVRPGGGRPWILLNGAVGVAGFIAGDRGHVLDPLLCDPLLARLPARDPAHWRIGHVVRRIPEGYYETLASGENRIVHPGLRAWYDVLRTLTQKPLGSRERLAAAWSMLTGEFDDGLRAFVAGDYRRPPRVPIAAASLPPPLPAGTFWFDEPRLRVVYDGGVAVQWPGAQSARVVRWQSLGWCDFRLRFVRGGEIVADVTVPQPPPANNTLRAMAGLREQQVAVPAALRGFDALWIDAVENALSHNATGPPALGAVTLLP